MQRIYFMLIYCTLCYFTPEFQFFLCQCFGEDRLPRAFLHLYWVIVFVCQSSRWLKFSFIFSFATNITCHVVLTTTPVEIEIKNEKQQPTNAKSRRTVYCLSIIYNIHFGDKTPFDLTYRCQHELCTIEQYCSYLNVKCFTTKSFRLIRMFDSTGSCKYCGMNSFPLFYWPYDNFENVTCDKIRCLTIFLI